MGIVSHEDRYIFIHVPRTGGHSAYRVLGVKSDKGLHKPRFKIEEAYFSFGFIRNPWDRMYSCYRKKREYSTYSKSFKHYLLDIQDEDIRHSALWYLEGCDYIGRFEKLQQEWDWLLKILDKPPAKLPLLNKCGAADYRKHYDNEMIDHIAHHHADDILFGDYTF